MYLLDLYTLFLHQLYNFYIKHVQYYLIKSKTRVAREKAIIKEKQSSIAFSMREKLYQKV